MISAIIFTWSHVQFSASLCQTWSTALKSGRKSASLSASFCELSLSPLNSCVSRSLRCSCSCRLSKFIRSHLRFEQIPEFRTIFSYLHVVFSQLSNSTIASSWSSMEIASNRSPTLSGWVIITLVLIWKKNWFSERRFELVPEQPMCCTCGLDYRWRRCGWASARPAPVSLCRRCR